MGRGSRGRVLVVDDVHENLLLLEKILKDECEVITAETGERAIMLATEAPQPDLILLDIMMPKMNGYIVITKLKASALTKDIPVIFITSMGDMKDEAKGLMLGAVDYIVKPIKASIVKARVRTHLQLRQARHHIQGLYDETLTGIISLLNDVMTATNPVAYSRAARIRMHMRKIIKKLHVERAWEYDLAAMLSQIGCVTLDTDVLEKIYSGQDVPVESNDLFTRHPRLGGDLLKKIPHLEKVSEIVGQQEVSFEKACGEKLRSYNVETGTGVSFVDLGVALLKIATTIDKFIKQGSTVGEAFHKVAAMLDSVHPGLAELLDDAAQDEGGIVALEINELRTDMVLANDLYTHKGMLLLSKETPLSTIVIERISAFNRSVGVVTPIFVFKDEN